MYHFGRGITQKYPQNGFGGNSIQSHNTSQKRTRTILNARVFFDAFYVCYDSCQPSDHSFLPSRFYLPFFTLQRFITATITSAGSCAHHTISGAGSLYFPGCHSFPFSAACKTPSSLADFSSDFHDTALPPFCRHIRSPDILYSLV